MVENKGSPLLCFFWRMRVRFHGLNLAMPYVLSDADGSVIEWQVRNGQSANLTGAHSSFRQNPVVGFIGFLSCFDDALHLIQR